MKHIFLFVAAVFIIVSVTLTACKKSANNNTPATTGNLCHLMAGLRNSPQSLSVTAGRDTVIYCARGTKLHFYTYSFVDVGGHPITSGTVNLSVTEIYKTGDFITNCTSTAAFDSLLNSGGEVFIAATMNGQPVYANKYGIGFTQSAPSSIPMQLFYGLIKGSDSTITWSKDYVPNPGTSCAQATFDVSGFSFLRYQFDSCAGFNWVNCDHFAGITSSKTNVKVVLPDASFNATNTQAFIALPGYRVTLGVGVYTSATSTYSLNTGSWLPLGASYEVIVIANKNGGFYYYESTGIITDGVTINAAMSAKTESEILTMLQTLN